MPNIPGTSKYPPHAVAHTTVIHFLMKLNLPANNEARLQIPIVPYFSGEGPFPVFFAASISGKTMALGFRYVKKIKVN